MTTFKIKIQLADVKPKVTRTIEIPAEATLGGLHEFIQAAMGWENYHAWEFYKGHFPQSDTKRYSVFEPDSAFMRSTQQFVGSHKVKEILSKPGDKATYMYDYGDSWDHHLSLEEVLDHDTKTATLIDAHNVCPTEDCGGFPGWSNFYETIQKGINGEPLDENDHMLFQWQGLDPDDVDNLKEFLTLDAEQLKSNLKRADPFAEVELGWPT